MAQREETYRSTGRRDVHLIPPEHLTLVNDPEHPLYDDRIHLPINEQLVKNIMVFGVKKPVIIRINGKDKKGHNILEVVDGRQRVRHSMEANTRLEKQGDEPISVPCIVEKGEDVDAIQTMVLTNEFNQTPKAMNRARKVKQLLDHGKTIAQIAIILNCSVPSVYNYQKLLDCCAEVQKAVEDGKLYIDVAKRFAALSREDQKKLLKEMLESGVTKGPLAIAHIENVANGRPSKPPTERSPKIRSRSVLEQFRESLSPTEADEADEMMDLAGAVIAWTLGDDAALRAYKDLHSKAKAFTRIKTKGKTERDASGKKLKKGKRKRDVEEIDV